jgi:molybdopterin/thiamine biosynthesis adenylyltransferase
MTPALHALLHAENPTSAPTYRPLQFRLSVAGDRRALEELLRSQPGIRVSDTLLTQLRDLIRSRHPSRKIAPLDLDSLAREHLRSTPAEEYGLWFYYPWSMYLVHLLGESEFVELRTNRNRYKINLEEQAELARKRIGVVGLSVGQSVALTLALERSFGELRLADFDTLDLSNLNRIRAGVHNLNLPKVYITAREIAEIDPYLSVTCFADGVSEANCDAFLVENSPLDVLVEECDSVDIKILLRQRARMHRIPVVMDTSDRGMIDVERFDQEPERAIFHGRVGDIGPSSLRGLTNEQKIPYILQILGVDTLSARLRASLIEVEQSISTWPQLASAVAHGGAGAADVVRRICLGDSVASGRYYVDLDALIPSARASRSESVEKETLASRPLAIQLKDMRSAIRALPRTKAGEGFVLTPDMARRLVSDAVQAPSGGNCQPWKWLSDKDQLFLFHDRSRAYTPFDPDCLGGLVGLGAAAENLILSAHASGLQVVSDVFPSKGTPELVARFRFSRNSHALAERSWRDELHSMVGVRRTNRKLCKRRPLNPDDQDALTAAARSIPDAEVHWLLRDEELDECGRLLGIGDRLLFLTESLNRFLVSEIRWTRQEADNTRDGICLESLELSPVDQAGFQLCRDWPTLDLVRRMGGGHGLEKLSSKALAGASAVGLITMPHRNAPAYFWGGRAVERLWLTAAQRQLALHPMTALAYMLSQHRAGVSRALDVDTQKTLHELILRYERLFFISEEEAAVFLFRLSYAEETTQRSLRRYLDEVLVIV